MEDGGTNISEFLQDMVLGKHVSFFNNLCPQGDSSLPPFNKKFFTCHLSYMADMLSSQHISFIPFRLRFKKKSLKFLSWWNH